MLADTNPQAVVPETGSLPTVDQWTVTRDSEGTWVIEESDTVNAISHSSVVMLLDVIGHFNLDQLPIDKPGFTLFDESSGQTYRLNRSSVDRIQLSETTTTKYLQQYLAEREALFSQSQRVSVGEMATTLAHEINQPIGAIQNLLQGMNVRLRKENPDLGEIRQVVNRSLEQTQYASRIVARIRDFTEAREPRYEVLTVRTLLEESARLLDWVFSTRSIQLELNCLPTLKVRGDYTMLQQVVTNLLRNSVEAIEASERSQTGVIKMESTLEEDRVRIQICDNGTGFDSSQQLFTPFATSKAEGMGVGLNICRSFIELHNGRLWLSSEKNTGSIANIQLPQAVKNDA